MGSTQANGDFYDGADSAAGNKQDDSVTEQSCCYHGGILPILLQKDNNSKEGDGNITPTNYLHEKQKHLLLLAKQCAQMDGTNQNIGIFRQHSEIFAEIC